MATCESDANAGFRRDLKHFYPSALVWNNSDKFRSGLPDTSVLYDGHFYALEGKFVRQLPKRKDSKCLDHEVSASQLEFILHVRRTSNYGGVLVFMQDVAVFMLRMQSNYTLDEVLLAPRRIERHKGKWDLEGFLEHVRSYHQ